VLSGLTCLPGRLAVLVPDAPGGAIVLPQAIRDRLIEMERPPVGLLQGTVVAVGAQYGRVTMPSVGDTVWVLPKPGLIIASDDLDIPSLGANVPPGHTLRIYGAGDDWHDAVLAVERTQREESERDDPLCHL
jgi:hypothetical protein